MCSSDLSEDYARETGYVNEVSSKILISECPPVVALGKSRNETADYTVALSERVKQTAEGSKA